MSRSMSTSPGVTQQPSMMDSQFDSLIDFSEYDNSYQSPSMSPTANKTAFARPIKAEPSSSTQGTLLTTAQPMSGPSHQYDLYKQQTGIVPGALASTLAVNENNAQIQGYTDFNSLDYINVGNAGMFDFNTAPSQGTMGSPDMDMEFESPNDSFLFNAEATVNPSSIGGQEPRGLPSPPVLATQTSNVGRMWPGMHQQAALAKAQAQQRQQQQIIQQQQQQQQQQRMSVPNPAKPAQRPKASQPSDPIVEQKITQLLNSMRVKPSMNDSQNAPLLNTPRPRKDEDMDDDERLLASEEGKKLSSKERRQLRNKVSARAFRSRRKEYITQLEAEIAAKVTENGDLRAQNRALYDENKRLSDLTRMLLASPSFSDFLDRLSTNPQMLPHTRPEQPQQQQQQQQPQAPKDVNTYAAQQQIQNHQIGMAMIPEQTMDFSMLNLNGGDANGFIYQPQVYTVETSEPPVIDTAMLTGKTSNFVGEILDSEDDKADMPVIEARLAVSKGVQKVEAAPIAAEPISQELQDPQFALYHSAPSEPAKEASESTVAEVNVECLSSVETIFPGVELEKVFARIELVDAREEEETATLAMARVQRISALLESTMVKLEALTADL